MIWWWRAHGRAWSRGVFRWRRGRGTEHPVRREAGYWLARLAAGETRGPEMAAVVNELQRLRFGASATWVEPEKTFRLVRRVLRESRSARSGQARRDRVTRS
jgi:hypothetical protein